MRYSIPGFAIARPPGFAINRKDTNSDVQLFTLNSTNCTMIAFKVYSIDYLSTGQKIGVIRLTQTRLDFDQFRHSVLREVQGKLWIRDT